MESYFIYNGIDTRKYGILVTGTNPYSTPARDYTTASVLGRNGDIIIDNGRFKNVEVSYTCEIKGDGSYTGFIERFGEFRKAIAMSAGYNTLIDSYNPGITRQAYLSATITPAQKGARWLGGSFVVSFSCQPQRYTSAGQTRVLLGSVVKGGIYGCGTDGGDDGVLNAVATRCRSGLISVTSGETIKISTSLTGSMQVYAAQYDADRACVTTGRVTVPADGIGTITPGDTTKYIRLCWAYNTLKTTDDATPKYLTLYTSTNVFRLGSDRVYYYFAGGYDTKPIVEFHTSSNQDARIYKMDSVYIRINYNNETSIGPGPVLMDCEKETFTKRDGTSVAQYVVIAQNEAITKASPVLPELHPGLNYIQSFADSWVYDPSYTLYLTTREWEV